jgi:hypothetical protein
MNTSSINSELFANLVAAAQYQAYENSVARQITTVFDVPANSGKVVQIPVWGAVSAQVITDEGAASFADTNTTSATLTLAEIVSAHRVSDMLRDSAASDVIAQLGDQAGRAIAEAMDKQVFDLFAGLTEMGPGAGAELTVAHLLKAAAYLRANKVTGPMFAVLNPLQAYSVKAELAAVGGTNLSNVGNQVQVAGYLGQVAGITVIESGLVAIDGSGDAVGGVFAPGAIAHAMRGAINLESQRQAALRATDVVLTAASGAAVINSAFGVKLTADATI